MSKLLNITEHYDEIAKRFARKALSHTCPLFRNDDSRGGDYVGSGLFVTVGENHFMVSAAHVLADAGDTLFVPVSDSPEAVGLMFRSGIYTTTKMTDGSRNKDKADIAVAELGTNEVDQLSGTYQSLSSEYVLSATKDLPHHVATIYGYPETRVRKGFHFHDKHYVPKPLIHTTTLAEKTCYDSLGFDPRFNVLVKYEGKAVSDSGDQVRLPLPFGMSGGGLWMIPKIIGADLSDPQFHLIGIMTEYCTECAGIISATIAGPFLQRLSDQHAGHDPE